MTDSPKLQLRQQFILQRKALSPQTWQQKSQLICQTIQSSPLYQQADSVLAYWSFQQEPDLSPLFNDTKRWGLPRCSGKSLVWHWWQWGEPLSVGKYGIREPVSPLPLVNGAEVDLILVPAVACDSQFYRLGYGGGFYDRMLSQSQWQNVPTLGIVFDFAYVSKLPTDSWDRSLDGVCTETAYVNKF
jgi:5-formyltetrahydrofolate cyclo-ligase